VGAPAPQCAALFGSRELLTALLESYIDIFTEPHGLPPPRRHDHHIRLLPETPLVAIRPYRYPQLLKDEIERQCDDMLQQGIIRECTSAYSSPVLLVKKADKSWRFCVDYREINSKTVKDKFPIPVVNELRGACFFTKLDLRSGYHQVCMHPDDIDKTAFRTHRGHFEFLVMPFGLTNAPSMFQSLMNGILKPFIRKFVLVFFDDILVFSSSWVEHLQHVKQVFEVLREHKLALTRPKCSFGEESVAYLRHIISTVGVAMAPAKVTTVETWPRPRTLRALNGFLGLTGYYRKFIAGYGMVAGPLTTLLKREAFCWLEEADDAFQQLKQALMTATLLQMPDFSKRFVVDCDASGVGFGVVLHQGDDAIAFFIRAVAPHHQELSAYERELIGLVKAVRNWRPYLWGCAFTVRTDHYSLKFLLDQRLSTIPQHTWVSKLFGYDLTVEYRSGKLNGAADALSRRDEEVAAIHSLSAPTFQLFDALRAEADTDPQVADLRAKLAAGVAREGWTQVDGLLLFEGKLFIPDASAIWPLIPHDCGHEGVEKTLHRWQASFYSPHAARNMREFVRGCTICQQNKTEHLHLAGLLQPLPVPSEV
jgi:hypothetical protein